MWDLSQPTEPRRREATARKRLRYLSVHAPTNELIKLAAQIDELTWRFDDIASAIFTETAQNAGQKFGAQVVCLPRRRAHFRGAREPFSQRCENTQGRPEANANANANA